jgi:hypothetical protein
MGSPEETRTTVDWLREAAEVVRRFARHATPIPSWWGDKALPSVEELVPGSARDPLDDLFEDPQNSRWTVLARSVAEPLAALLDALAQSAERTLAAGGSISGEPYRSALALAKRVIEAAESSSPLR